MHGTLEQTPLLAVSDGLEGVLNFLLVARMMGKWEGTSAGNGSKTKMLEAFPFSKEEHDSNCEGCCSDLELSFHLSEWTSVRINCLQTKRT